MQKYAVLRPGPSDMKAPCNLIRLGPSDMKAPCNLIRLGPSDMKAPCNLIRLGPSRAQLVITLFFRFGFMKTVFLSILTISKIVLAGIVNVI